ncbi:MAG: DedA family protein [Bacilli bacterium]
MQEIIITVIEKFGYLGILLLIAVENLFPPIPSEVILTFGGFATSFTKLSLVGVIIFSTIGSLVGAIILYYIGTILSEERLEKIVKGKIGKILCLKNSDIKKAYRWFSERGNKTVFFCRFIPIVRSLISIPAGMSKMKFFPFFVLTLFGSLIWNTVLTLLGSVAGKSWGTIANVIDSYSKITLFALIALFIAGVVVFYIKKKKKK